MKTILISLAIALAAPAAAFAASITNNDADTQVLVITENGDKREVSIEAGARIDICPAGCFLRMPSGDVETLIGNENVEIVNGSAITR